MKLTSANNLKKLRATCVANKESFADLGKKVETPCGRFYIYKDNGASILAVAHLDTVAEHKESRLDFDAFSHEGKFAHSPNLDDRLGVFLLTEVLPKMGLKYDLLLCDGEEVGASTAIHFETEKNIIGCLNLIGAEVM